MNRSAAAAAAAVLLAGCGAGSSGPGDPDPIPRTVVDPLACQSEPHRALAGTYLGVLTYDETPTGGAYCEWTVALRIDAEAAPEGSCTLSGAVVADVEQSVVPAPVEPFAEECRAVTRTALMILDPFGTAPPMLQYQALGAVAERGPYFGDTSVVADYVHPFGGIVPVFDALAVEPGAGDLVPLDRRPVSGRVIGGRLVRE